MRRSVTDLRCYLPSFLSLLSFPESLHALLAAISVINYWHWRDNREYHILVTLSLSLSVIYCYAIPDLGRSWRRFYSGQFWPLRSDLVVRKRLHFMYRWYNARRILSICSFRNLLIQSLVLIDDTKTHIIKLKFTLITISLIIILEEIEIWKTKYWTTLCETIDCENNQRYNIQQIKIALD